MEPLLPEDGSNVALAPGMHARASDLRFQYSRSGGPGGQNVNKVNTKAELWVGIGSISGLSDRAAYRLAGLAGRRLTAAGEIHIASESERTQEGNRAEVMRRLRELLIAAAHEPKPRRKTKPTRGSKERRLTAKKMRGQIKSGRSGRGDD